MPVSGSAAAPFQFDPPAVPGMMIVPLVPPVSPAPTDGGVNSGP